MTEFNCALLCYIMCPFVKYSILYENHLYINIFIKLTITETKKYNWITEVIGDSDIVLEIK
jgi:hypothetical protein